MKKVCPAIAPELLRAALEASSNGIVISEVKGNEAPIIYINPAFEAMTGFSFEDVAGKDCRILNKLARGQKELETIRIALKKQEACQVTLLNHKKNGEPFWNELSLSPVFSENGELTHYVGVQKDVTEQVKQQLEMKQYNQELIDKKRELEELAHKDPLTGLFNRGYFEEELDKIWSIHQRQETQLGFIFIDIDHFKLFNDTYGHLEGDKVIKLVAEQLMEKFARKADVVARFGGEEFVAVVSLKNDLSSFRNHLESLRASIEDLHIKNENSDVSPFLTISTGACYGLPPKNASPSLFTREADAAMYRAKRNGRNQVEIFHYQEKPTLTKKLVS